MISNVVSQVRVGRTFAAWTWTAGLVILALRGIVVDRDRESQLSGLYAGPQEGRRNINGMYVVMVVVALRAWTWRKFFAL